MGNGNIPIVVGVTGHRDLVEEDIAEIKNCVEEALAEIRGQCNNDTPVIMLNAFAEGADILCAEVAFAMGIDVYALLPCPPERYVKSFDDEAVAKALPGYLEKAKRVMVAPDVEKNKEWIDKVKPMEDTDYEYRQMGINMVSNSHILLALWDGKPSEHQFGCGTAEVVKFALEQNYLSDEHLYRPGFINECAVEWISVRRKKNGQDGKIRCRKIQRRWLSSRFAPLDYEKSCRDQVVGEWRVEPSDYCEAPNGEKSCCDQYIVGREMPAFLKESIEKTAVYNSENTDLTVSGPELWTKVDELDDYHKALRRHYIKADKLSREENQKKYANLLLIIACLGTLFALFFTMYDDASIKWMIWLCTGVLILLIVLTKYGRRKRVLEKYVEYRAFAEALRIQFYVSMILQGKPSPEFGNRCKPFSDVVCEFYAWTQKSNHSWIAKAIKSVAIKNERTYMPIDPTEIVNVWIGDGEKLTEKRNDETPTGQRDGEKLTEKCNDKRGDENPTGQRDEKKPTSQLGYHRSKIDKNRKQAELNAKISSAIRYVMISIYVLIFLFEVASFILGRMDIPWFWDGMIVGEFSWRNLGVVCVGTATAGALLFSGYFDKLSYDRKAEDNKNMIPFYISVRERWNDVAKMNDSVAVEKFIKEVAREEIVENGIWCSYVMDNDLEIEL